MAGKRSARIESIKQDLIARVKDGYRRPGNWFFSNRELAKRYKISYETAHRLISELCQEGYIHRTPASGTYVANEEQPPEGVVLYLHPYAQDKDSFGEILRKKLVARLEAEKIPVEIRLQDTFPGYEPGRFAIIWGNRFDLRTIFSDLHYCLLIDQRAPSGLCSVYTDSLVVDYESAGRSAGELMALKPGIERPIVFLGPPDYSKMQSILRGFQTVFPEPIVVAVDSWLPKDYLREAKRLSKLNGDAVFSTHDGATLAVEKSIGQSMPHLGFCYTQETLDGNPTNLFFPWDKLVDEAINIYRKRSMGDTTVATQHIFSAPLSGISEWLNKQRSR